MKGDQKIQMPKAAGFICCWKYTVMQRVVEDKKDVLEKEKKQNMIKDIIKKTKKTGTAIERIARTRVRRHESINV